MPCYDPIHGFRAPGGQIKSSRAGAFRDRPITIPCGRCTGCKLEHARQWSIRIMHEAQMHHSNCFLTLTYSPEHLPKNNSVNVEHFKLFLKTLRNNGYNVRYFHCGEYGSEQNHSRPHYHACMFGTDFSKDRTLAKLTDAGHPLYISETLDALWGLGQCWIGELTSQSANYTARYILKKITGPNASMHYQDLCPITGKTWEVRPEYITMSRNPGIGATWIQKYMDDVYPSDEIVTEGKISKPPRFYDAEYKKQNPEGFKALRIQRYLTGLKHQSDNTRSRLIDKQKVKLAQMSQLRRE